MIKVFASEWHGINFESFWTPDAKGIAGSKFYETFYDIFFSKYRDEDDLDSEWTELKMQVKDWLAAHPEWDKRKRILSLGCGIGLIEKGLVEDGFVELEVTEVSTKPLRWLKRVISDERIHVGLFPECIPSTREWDIIYAVSMDYLFDQKELKVFLEEVKTRVVKGGMCVVISHSVCAGWDYFLARGKTLVKEGLASVGLWKLGQFWGYARTPEELCSAFKGVGFHNIKWGFLQKKTKWETYWIEGHV